VVVGLVAEEVEVEVAGFVAVEVVVAVVALGAVAYAAQMREDEKLRCADRYAIGAALDDDDDR